MLCPFCQTNLTDPTAGQCSRCGRALSIDKILQSFAQQIQYASQELAACTVKVQQLEHHASTVQTFVAARAEHTQSAPPPASDVPLTRPSPHRERRPEPPRPAPRAPTPQNPQAEIHFGQKWLLTIGVITIVLGIAYFLKYSFDQNWVGPAGRVTMSYVWSLAGLGAGEWFRRKRFSTFGLYLIGGSLAALYASNVAAYQLYELIPQSLAFILMIVVTAMSGVLALVYDTRALAMLGLLGGFLSPYLVAGDHGHHVVFLSYLIVLNLGIAAIALFKRWKELTYAGGLLTWGLFTAWYLVHDHPIGASLTLFFVQCYFLLYVAIPFAYYFLREAKPDIAGFAIVIPNTFFAYAYSKVILEQLSPLPLISIVAVTYAALYLGLALQLWRRCAAVVDAVIWLLGMGVVFLIITVPALCSGHWVTIFWALQSGALFWIARRVGSPALARSAGVLLAINTGRLFLDYDATFHFDWIEWHFYGGALALAAPRLVTASFAIGSLRWAVVQLQRFAKPPAGAIRTLHIAFGVLLFLFLNAEVSGWMFDYVPAGRFAAISVLWSLCAIALLILGFRFSLCSLRRCGIGLFLVTVLKVFCSDMSNVATPFRILSFIVLGLLLVGASYMYYYYRDRVGGDS